VGTSTSFLTPKEGPNILYFRSPLGSRTEDDHIDRDGEYPHSHCAGRHLVQERHQHRLQVERKALPREAEIEQPAALR
jgi:hypothetical protein